MTTGSGRCVHGEFAPCKQCMANHRWNVAGDYEKFEAGKGWDEALGIYRRVHSRYECRCNKANCPLCQGALFLCAVCGGAEGSLLPECPGYRLTPAQHDQNYRDYCAKTGPFASPLPERDRHA